MRSLGVAALLLFVGCVMIMASPAPFPSSSSPSTFSITEYEVDANGLWSDHEIPLSDASMEAIRHATPATEEDIHAWNAQVEPDMQIQVMEEENETEAENETDADSDNENENENNMTQQDELEITEGSHGRMLLIPHSPRLHMRSILHYLTRLLSKMKSHTPLARLTLKLKVEPVMPPTSTPTPTPPPRRPAPRRPAPPLGIRYRPRPVAVRLVPSRQLLSTRRILARCQMLLRKALQRMRTMRQMMIRERMTRLRGTRALRFPGRGVILFRSNNITTHGPTYQRITRNQFEMKGEKNSTIMIIAPRINATLEHSVIVINRGTLILMNRAPNNTLSVIPTPHDGRRHFWLPHPRRHHMMNVADVDNHDTPHDSMEPTPTQHHLN